MEDAVERVVPDQLLVSTPYVSPVLQKLDLMDIPLRSTLAGASREDTEDSAALGLTRIFLAGAYGPGTEIEERTSAFDIQSVLQSLRLAFAKENAGWYPTMGKNRALADNIIEGGSMIYGGTRKPGVIQGDQLSKLEERWDGQGNGRPSEPGSRVRIGLVDTKILAGPPLVGALRGRYKDMLSPDGQTARAGHATFVAGLILSVAPGATIEVRGILDNKGQADSWDAAKAIVELGSSGVDVLNLSFGCLTGDGQPPLALATAVDLVDPQTVIVAAAGNHDPNGRRSVTIDTRQIADITQCASYPAALDNVIAVGSAKGQQVEDYSPHGDWVDAYADGTDVTSTFLKTLGYKGFAAWTGTSFAAALVSGTIAAETKPGNVPARAAWETVKKRPSPPVRRLGLSPAKGLLVTADQWFGR